MLLSDLGRPGQNALLDQGIDLGADIVVTGLPDKGEPLCDALLAGPSQIKLLANLSGQSAVQRAIAQ